MLGAVSDSSPTVTGKFYREAFLKDRKGRVEITFERTFFTFSEVIPLCE